MKAIYDKLSKFYERKIAGCSCGGRECTYAVDRDFCIDIVYSQNACGPDTCASYAPCPLCAELRARLKGLCWHEWESRHIDGGRYQVYVCKNCGIDHPHAFSPKNLYPNIDLTTHLTGSKPTVRVLLEEAGLWKRFRRWLCLLDLPRRHEITGEVEPGDIFTDLELLCRTVEVFLQEVNSGN